MATLFTIYVDGVKSYYNSRTPLSEIPVKFLQAKQVEPALLYLALFALKL